MLTKVEFELINSFVRLSCKLGLAPLDWNEEELRATTTTKKWKRYSSGIFTVVGYAYLAFVIARFPLTFQRYKISNKLGEAIMHCLLFNVRFSVFAAIITSSLHMREVAHFLTLTTNLNRKYGNLNLRREFSEPNLREKCLQLLVRSFYAFSTFFGLTFLVNSSNPGFIFSVLPEYYRTTWTLGIFCTFEIIYTFLLTVNTVTLIILLFAYLTSVSFWLSYEWPVMDNNSFEEATRAYQSIFILSTLQRNTLSGLHTPICKLAASIASMVAIYVIIRLGDRLSFVTYLMCIMCIIITYVMLIGGALFMANVYEFSNQFRDRLDKCNSDGGIKKEKRLHKLILKSLAPIKCRVGNTYFMDKDAKGTLVDNLINGTVSLLLTLDG